MPTKLQEKADAYVWEKKGYIWSLQTVNCF